MENEKFKAGDTIEWSIKYSKIIKITTIKKSKKNENEIKRNLYVPSADK